MNSQSENVVMLIIMQQPNFAIDKQRELYEETAV